MAVRSVSRELTVAGFEDDVDDWLLGCAEELLLDFVEDVLEEDELLVFVEDGLLGSGDDVELLVFDPPMVLVDVDVLEEEVSELGSSGCEVSDELLSSGVLEEELEVLFERMSPPGGILFLLSLVFTMIAKMIIPTMTAATPINVGSGIFPNTLIGSFCFFCRDGALGGGTYAPL